MNTIEKLRELRARTGSGLFFCKKALEEAQGDVEQAIELLRIQGQDYLRRKAGRIAAEGRVECYIDAERRVGAIVEVNCETDFAAKSAQFAGICHDIAEKVARGESYDKVVNNAIAILGENVRVRRVQRYKLGELDG